MPAAERMMCAFLMRSLRDNVNNPANAADCSPLSFLTPCGISPCLSSPCSMSTVAYGTRKCKCTDLHARSGVLHAFSTPKPRRQLFHEIRLETVKYQSGRCHACLLSCRKYLRLFAHLTPPQNKFRISLIARDYGCLVTDVMYDYCTASHIVPFSRPDVGTTTFPACSG
jgi:hypothetical protein